MTPAKRYVMLIDLQLCTGCDTCSVACKQENNLPDGVWWNRVFTVSNGDNASQAHLNYLPLACQHCVNAPCVEVCPTNATTRREDTGLVMQDPSLCIGCRYCTIVCPFTGVRVYAKDTPTYVLPYAIGDSPFVHRRATVEKCTFCAHRLAAGQQPACVEFCPVNARIFGDLNDPNSEVSEVLRTRAHFRLLVEKGTEPSAYYLV